jgi:hypothetical protein
MIKLNESTLTLYAAQNYINEHCYDVNEFYSDLQIPSHIKKLFTRYSDSGILKERLILNHMISLFNVFEPNAAIAILFFKVEENHYPYLKTVLYYLNRCPKYIHFENDKINTENIELDIKMLALLNKV